MTTTPGTLLVGTRKGLLTFTSDGDGWRFADEAFPGVAVEYACVDPRDGTTWAALHHGHWGPKLHRRPAGGEWEEVAAPAYPPESGATLANLWIVAPGHPDRPGEVWLGTNPGGLFRSTDGGATFALCEGLWRHDSRPDWFGGGRDTPGIHSVVLDPRDPDRLLVGVSCGGVFETTDGGATWVPRNRGVLAPFLPDPEPETGQDPHFVAACAAAPDVLWQQNHHGVYRSTDGGRQWTDVAQPDGPVGFGFPVAAHPDDPDTAWVVPATADTERAAADRRLRVFRTTDGGRSWASCSSGLPAGPAWDLVYRHALAVGPRGRHLAFGSTTGNLWASADGGDGWTLLSHHLPPVYSVRLA